MLQPVKLFVRSLTDQQEGSCRNWQADGRQKERPSKIMAIAHQETGNNRCRDTAQLRHSVLTTYKSANQSRRRNELGNGPIIRAGKTDGDEGEE